MQARAGVEPATTQASHTLLNSSTTRMSCSQIVACRSFDLSVPPCFSSPSILPRISLVCSATLWPDRRVGGQARQIDRVVVHHHARHARAVLEALDGHGDLLGLPGPSCVAALSARVGCEQLSGSIRDESQREIQGDRCRAQDDERAGRAWPGVRGSGPGLRRISGQADPSAAAVPGGRRGRHRRARDGGENGRRPRQAVRDREQGRRRRHHRDRCGGEGRARRLHAPADHAEPHHQRGAASRRCPTTPRRTSCRSR